MTAKILIAIAIICAILAGFCFARMSKDEKSDCEIIEFPRGEE